MPDVKITLTDDELAAVKWAVTQADDPRTYPNPETWVYIMARGEIKAAQSGYIAARDAEVIRAVQTFDAGSSVGDLRQAVEDAVTKTKEVLE